VYEGDCQAGELTSSQIWSSLSTCVEGINANDEIQIDGRVIVDGFGYFKGQNQVIPKLSRNILKLETETDSDEEESDSGSESDNDDDDENENDDTKPDSAKVVVTNPNLQRHEEFNELTPIECILAPPRVRGFDLRTKEWCKFSPFPKLTLPLTFEQVFSTLTTSRTRPGTRPPMRNSFFPAVTRKRS